VQGGIGEGEGLAGKVAEVGFFEGLCVGDGIAGVVGLIVTGGGDEQEAMLGVGGIGLEPALGDLARIVMGGIAGAFVRGEADGDGGVAVKDAEVDFGFGEVSVGAGGGGVEDGGVTLRLLQRAVGAKVGIGSDGRVAEVGWINDRGDAMPLFVLRYEDGTDQVLVEFNGENRVEIIRGAEGDEIEADRVREGNVAVVQILRGRADGCKRRGAGAVVRGLELAGERLRRGDGRVHRKELECAQDRTRGRERLRCGDGFGGRRCGWGRPEIVALGRGCADDAEQGERKSGE